MAVLINLPFGGGGLLRRLSKRPLPQWATEIDCHTWAQILLKFVVGHPAVTCVIPGHHRSGTEVVCEEMRVQDGPLCFEMKARCGFESTFDYASA